MKSWLLVIYFFSEAIFFGTLSLFSQSHNADSHTYTYFNITLISLIGVCLFFELLKKFKKKKYDIPVSKFQVFCIVIALIGGILISFFKFQPSEIMPQVSKYFFSLTAPAIILALSASRDDLAGMYDKLKYVNIYISVCFASLFLNIGNLQYGMFNDLAGATHLTVGYAMSALFTFNLLKFINHKRFFFKMIYLFLLAFNVLTIIFSGSRGSLVVIVAVFIIASFKYLFNRRRIIMLVALSFLAFGLFQVVSSSDNFGFAIDRIISAFNTQEDQSSRERIELYQTAINSFKESPILGNGIGSFSHAVGKYYYPHNIGMEIMNDFGIIGTAFTLIIFFIIFRKSKWLLQDNYRYHLIVFLFINVLVQLIFSGSYLISSQFWLSGVLIWGLAKSNVGILSAGKQEEVYSSENSRIYTKINS